MTEDQFLIDEYDRQPHFVDKLGGTDELKLIVNRLNARFDRQYSASQVLSRLIAMRKRGDLSPKHLKTKKAEVKTWGKSDTGLPTITITVAVQLIEMTSGICSFNVENERMPLSRQELHDFFLKRNGELFPQGDWTEDFDEDEVKAASTRATQLFPELLP